MDVDGPALLSVVPVALYQHGQRAPEVVGSGVLAHVFGQGVLLTAAHVLDKLADGQCSYRVPSGGLWK